MTRDWTKTLQPASFRGVAFYVDEEQLADSGRAIAVHTFVKAEEHATEDMGRKVRRWRIDGYVASDTADTDMRALVEVCSQEGDGPLVLPLYGSVTVKCERCTASGRKTELGLIKVAMEFIESGNDSAFETIAIGDRVAASLMSRHGRRRLFGPILFCRLSGMVMDRSLALVGQTARAIAIVLTATAARLPLSVAQGQAARRQVYLLSAVLAPQIAVAADVAAIGALVCACAAAMAADVDAADAVTPFYDAAAACAVAAPTFASPARTMDAAFGRRLAGCGEATFLGRAFVAQAQSAFPDRQSAIAARQRVADAMDASLDRIAAETGQIVVELLMQIANVTSDHIATVAADLQPIVRVRTPRSAPSSALAYALYQEPSRAQELVARNGVLTPLFMPTALDALSPDA